MKEPLYTGLIDAMIQKIKTHRDVEKLVKKLDAEVDLMRYEYDGYCVWPVVKVALWRFLLNHHIADELESMESVFHRNYGYLIKYYTKLIFRALSWFFLGTIEKTRNFKNTEKNGIIIHHPPKTVVLKNSEVIDRYFGTFISDNFTNKTIICINHSYPTAKKQKNTISVFYIRAIIMARIIIKKVFFRYGKANKVISDIHKDIKRFSNGCELFPRALVKISLYYFIESRYFYKKFYKKHQPKAVLVTDFDAHFGEMAAAKDLGINAYDVQHGTVWTGDLDHSCSKEKKKYKNKMPLPKKLLLFGRFWKDISKEQKFWEEEELDCIGSAVIDRFLDIRRPSNEITIPENIKILYLSGDIKPVSIAKFLQNMVSVARSKLCRGFKLYIKLHPRECRSDKIYKNLVTNNEEVIIISDETPAVELSLNSDFIVGSSTSAMIEALMLGIPVFSINAGATPEGIGEMHNSKTLKSLIPHTSSPEKLVEAINGFIKDQDSLKIWMEKVEENLDYFYTRNFENNLIRIIDNSINKES